MPSENDLTAVWSGKLAELVGQEVANPPPAENAVIAQITHIDGTGIATLVNKLTEDAKKYGGFALILKHDPGFKGFQWLQFITRQLVVDGAAKTGNLVIKTNTTAYQLVNSAAEITSYDFAPEAKPSNWDTCWKVDSNIKSPFFADAFEWAISDQDKVTAILDAPGILVGQIPFPFLKKEYEDIPDGLVDMKKELGEGEGISRAYFSDYLVKTVDGKQHIHARFDFSVTWNAKEKERSNFTLRSLATTATTSLLDCHMAALNHTTTRGNETWKAFRESIV